MWNNKIVIIWMALKLLLSTPSHRLGTRRDQKNLPKPSQLPIYRLNPSCTSKKPNHSGAGWCFKSFEVWLSQACHSISSQIDIHPPFIIIFVRRIIISTTCLISLGKHILQCSTNQRSARFGVKVSMWSFTTYLNPLWLRVLHLTWAKRIKYG